eukprot:CFRG5059T1
MLIPMHPSFYIFLARLITPKEDLPATDASDDALADEDAPASDADTPAEDSATDAPAEIEAPPDPAGSSDEGDGPAEVYDGPSMLKVTITLRGTPEEFDRATLTKDLTEAIGGEAIGMKVTNFMAAGSLQTKAITRMSPDNKDLLLKSRFDMEMMEKLFNLKIARFLVEGDKSVVIKGPEEAGGNITESMEANSTTNGTESAEEDGSDNTTMYIIIACVLVLTCCCCCCLVIVCVLLFRRKAKNKRSIAIQKANAQKQRATSRPAESTGQMDMNYNTSNAALMQSGIGLGGSRPSLYNPGATMSPYVAGPAPSAYGGPVYGQPQMMPIGGNLYSGSVISTSPGSATGFNSGGYMYNSNTNLVAQSRRSNFGNPVQASNVDIIVDNGARGQSTNGNIIDMRGSVSNNQISALLQPGANRNTTRR